MFKKTDNIIFERINQMKDVMEPPSPPAPPAPPAPSSQTASVSDTEVKLTPQSDDSLKIPQSPSPPKPPLPPQTSKPSTPVTQLTPTPPEQSAKVPPMPDTTVPNTSLSTQLVHPPQNVPTQQGTNKQDVDKFKQICKQWLALNADIKKLQDAIKVRRQFQSELTPKMMGFMKEQNIEDLDTGDGKLKYTISNRKAPLNKDNIQKKLAEYFKDNKKAESVATFLMENRDIVQSERLSRTLKRKKKAKKNQLEL